MPLIRPLKRREKIGKVTTVREFTGGWNVVDNEFNMPPRYARIMRNVLRQSDGTIGPRRGCELFADIANFDVGTIVNMDYFSTYLICVTTSGAVVAIDGQGTAFLIFDEQRASALPGSPDPWSATTFASFSQFKSKLVICNGIDKPLVVDRNLNCTYLVDAATGGNINTPIGRYSAAAVGDLYGYLVIAGNPYLPSTLHIGNADSLGTFVGDTAPNDAVDFDLGAKVTAGDATIKGLRFYRDRLLVGFDEVVIAVQLGTYDQTDHTPLVTDVIESFGCFSHRTMFPLNEDVFMADVRGASFITRSKLSTSLTGDRADDLVQPEIEEATSALSTATLEDRVFAVQNHNDDQWMLFVPNHDDLEHTTESRGYILSRVGRESSWSEIRNWNWTCGCHSLQNHIFFGGGTQVYHYAGTHDDFYGDFVGDQEMFTDNTQFTDHTGFTPVIAGEKLGVAVPWVWELPWADFDKRMNLKKSLFLSVDASGISSFNVKMFADDIYADPNDMGEPFQDGYLFSDDTGFNWYPDPPLVPALTHDFVGGGRGGFGVDEFGQLFGGGNRGNTPKLYRWPARFKIAKFRFSGDSFLPLRIAAFSISYQEGSLRR